MAKFKIELELQDNKRVLLTDYDSTRESNIINTTGEELVEEEHDAYSLNFNIIGTINNIPYEKIINISRPLWLTYGRGEDYRELKMIITNFSRENKENNVLLSVEARDYASAIFSKNNVGLFFDTLDDEDYWYWLEKRDKDLNGKETENLRGSVEDIGNYILERGWLRKELLNSNGKYYIEPKTNKIAFEGWSVEYIRTEEDGIEPTLKFVNMDLSDSNTYNGLIELANTSHTLLRFDYVNKIVKLIDEEESLLTRNFYLKEKLNIESLDHNIKGDDLSGILYIDGIQDENDEYVFAEDKEISYRDNFLYNLDYYVDAGIIGETQQNDIKNKIESKIDSGSLLNINLSLEDAIKEKHEREGVLFKHNTALETSTYPLFLEKDPTNEAFIQGYKEFEEILERKTKGTELKYITTVGYWKVSQIELNYSRYKKISIDKTRYRTVSYKGKNIGGFFNKDTNTTERLFRFSNINVIFYETVIEGDPSTEIGSDYYFYQIFPSSGSPINNSVSKVCVYAKRTDFEIMGGSSHFNSFVRDFKLEFAFFITERESEITTTAIINYPYFENIYFLGGKDLVQKEIDNWKIRGTEFLPDWREEYLDRWTAKWVLSDSTITEAQRKEYERLLALAEERIETYNLVYGDYTYQDFYSRLGEDADFADEGKLAVSIYWNAGYENENDPFKNFTGEEFKETFRFSTESPTTIPAIHDILNWTEDELYEIPYFMRDNILEEYNWSEEVENLGQFMFIYDKLNTLWENAQKEEPFSNNAPGAITIYYNELKRKKDFWYTLKNTYGQHLFTEAYYEDDIETNPKMLYYQAKRAFDDYKKPLDEISIDYIHINELKLVNNFEPKVGDYIIVEGFEDKDRQLKIESISRSLKKDNEIVYEIKKFSPGRRLVEKLIKEVYQ